MCKYSIVIPVYGSGKWMDELVERIGRVMSNMGKPFELILVNDASPDDVTWPAIVCNAKRHGWVHGIDLLYNVGQFRASLCGMEQIHGGDYVITMDDDLQHPPEEIPKLIRAMEEHPQMQCIIGAYGSKRHSLFRNLGSRLVGLLFQSIYGKPKGLQTTSFHIMRRQLAQAITAHRTVKPVLGALILQSTRQLMNVEVEHHPRPYGKSGYRLARLVSHTLDNVFNSSTAPLRAISLLGFGIAAVSFVLGIVYFVRWWLGLIGEPGFTTIVVLIAFGGGVVLSSIGLLGEYIARVITEVTGPPRYIIRDRIGGREEAAPGDTSHLE